MEEEDFCSSLPEATNSVVFAPCQESRTSTEHQYLNGQIDDVAKEHTELLITQEEEPEHIYFHTAHKGTAAETETWEQIIWPVCNTTPPSLAAEDWDMSRPSSGTPPHVTDKVVANQPDSDALTQAFSASFPIHSESVHSDLFKEAEAEEQDEFDSWLLLCSESEWMGPNLKPCDTESTKAHRTQEEEHSTHKLLDHAFGTSLRTSVQGDKNRESVEADFIHSCVEIQFAEFIEDDIEHLRLVESPDKSDILLTGHTDLEEEPALVNGDEIAAGDRDEGQLVTNEEATAACHLNAVEVTAEVLRSEETNFSINTDKLIDLQQLLEDLSLLEKTVTEQNNSHQFCEESSEAPVMCKDVYQHVCSEQADEEEQTGVSEVTTPAAESTTQENSLEAFNLQKDFDSMTDNTQKSQNTAGNQVQEQHDDPSPTEEVEGIQINTSYSPTPQEILADLKVTEKFRTKHNKILHEVKKEEAMEENKTLLTENTGENVEQSKVNQTVTAHMNGEVDRDEARLLADRLFKLDGIQRKDVVKYLDKDNSFSHAVGEEYLKYFDFSGQTMDQALRSFLSVVVLIGESQERERVLQHFSCRYHECNQGSFSSPGSVLALTCAMMLLNTDLHGQHVGKSMSSSKFVSNLDGMNEGENFNKDLLKSLYNSIKAEPLQWALDEEELSNVLLEEDNEEVAPLRSKANPFLNVPHDKNAVVIKQGFLQRKIHADVDGKRTPWGKRGWKIFNAMLRGMVLYFQKDEYRREQQISEEVVSVHHSLAEEAAEYTKRPHVFRLQTADWRVFLFQASSRAEMASWINRINLVSALHSSPPFPAAVGSQRRFCRPILPASQSANTLDRQLQSHVGMLESFRADLSYLHENPPEGRRAKAKELEEHRLRAEYLQHEICRYEAYIQVLEVWKSVKTSDDSTINSAELGHFDRKICAEVLEEDEEGGLKKSHSSPSLELEVTAPAVVKVKRNISERRTYRRAVVPKWNKED
ncbi:PH and SEC7 domain-containing protein 4 [Boleophthalmus pectinirostris]|uniref:PH and SEC7 domain-containing protein 4 n=1 Tax=Boleophthalmus pectinirostris TaxID=150288 RepID=UPI00242D7D2A|nr:PH and SEC7 domain-containing protein 4 [Boleophthalmus pectinirostris]XP_055009392.1 PH and SEC7 domain-containing protein 4 [Boleophthalmus pectinirostris]XP_055009393.1 PH and SEC7 domain-containing protein 4 [Boleophthalmus pectinirostris]